MMQPHHFFQLFVFLLTTGLLTGCSRPYHPTAQDSLSEFPGRLLPSQVIIETIEILEQQAHASGQSLLYRWQTEESQSEGAFCISATFSSPTWTLHGWGWRAQSSGGTHECSVTDAYLGWYPGGNTVPLTTAFGVSEQGSHVHIVWSDGLSESIPILDGAFLHIRPESLQVLSMELLDEEGRVLLEQVELEQVE